MLCYEDEVTQESLELHTMTQTLHSMWTRLGRIQHLQYTRGVWGRQLPQGGMLLPDCFTVLAGHGEGKEDADAAALLS